MGLVNHTTVSLPPARAAQLRAIADIRGGGLVEAIEHLLREEVKAGRLADDLPGFEARAEGGTVRLAIGGVELPPVRPAQARLIAALFRHASGAMPEGRGNALELGDHGLSELVVGRQGRGVVIRVIDVAHARQERTSMTPGMALDYARQIDKAASRAQTQA